MTKPIAAFTGTGGNKKFSEFLKALRNEQYNKTARGIALQLVNLDPDSDDFDSSISLQSESIKENLQEYLRSIQETKAELAETKKEVAEAIKTIEDICDEDSDNEYHELYGPDEDRREELLSELFPESGHDKPLLKALEKQVRNDCSMLDGTILAAKELQARVEALEAENREISLAFLGLAQSVQAKAPQILFEDVEASNPIAVRTSSGGDELVVRATAVLNGASSSSERRATTPPPQVAAVLLSAPALLASPSKSPSRAGNALQTGLMAIERSSASDREIAAQATARKTEWELAQAFLRSQGLM